METSRTAACPAGLHVRSGFMHPASLRAFWLSFTFLLTVSACAPASPTGDDEGEVDDVAELALDPPGEAQQQTAPLPFDRPYRIPLRVHRGDTGLSPQTLASVLEEVNEI